jgi:hypothetical protein
VHVAGTLDRQNRLMTSRSRPLPYLLLGLLTVGAGLGIRLGLSEAPVALATFQTSAELRATAPNSSSTASVGPSQITTQSPFGVEDAQDGGLLYFGPSPTSCMIDPTFSDQADASDDIFNPTDTTIFDFTISVTFLEGGLVVGHAQTTDDNVVPGQDSTWSASGEITGGSGGPLRCLYTVRQTSEFPYNPTAMIAVGG